MASGVKVAQHPKVSTLSQRQAQDGEAGKQI
jgi:hypothetical protein